MKDLGVDGEVVVADNGSTDGSQEIACRLGRARRRRAGQGVRQRATGGISAALGVRRHGRRRRQLRPHPTGPVSRGAAGRCRSRRRQPIQRRHQAGLDAEAEPIRREPGAHGARTSVLSEPEPRLPLRDSLVTTFPHPGTRPAHGRDGVRQRDGRSGHAGEARDRRGPGYVVAQTVGRDRRTFGGGATAGGISAFSCCTAPAGCSSTQGSP